MTFNWFALSFYKDRTPLYFFNVATCLFWIPPSVNCIQWLKRFKNLQIFQIFKANGIVGLQLVQKWKVIIIMFALRSAIEKTLQSCTTKIFEIVKFETNKFISLSLILPFAIIKAPMISIVQEFINLCSKSFLQLSKKIQLKVLQSRVSTEKNMFVANKNHF